MPIMRRNLIILMLCALMSLGNWLDDNKLLAADKSSAVLTRIEISSPPKIKLSGAVGTYPIEPVKIRVFVGEGHYQLRLTATPLRYQGNQERGKYELDTVYWIDQEHQRLTMDTPYLLSITNSPLEKGKTRCLEMVLYGRVRIHQISAQPAGEYTGKVFVTVIRMP